jgi:GT2 family glycosyltransferase
MTEPSILTIILNYRTPEMTLGAAEAAMRDMAGLRGEVLIVDNDSDDGSLALMTQAATDRGWTAGNRCRLVGSGRNGGFGAGMNFGIATGLSDGSAPDYYYLLNSDAFPDPGAIAALRDFLQATPKAGMAGSLVRGLDGTPHHTAFRFPSIAGEFEAAAHTGAISRLLAKSAVVMAMPQQTCRVDWTAGASLMLRAGMVERIGGFDESYFLYFEETDLCRRAARAGWETWFVRESTVAHIGSATTGAKTWTRMPGYWFDSRRNYFIRNHGHAYAALATLSWVAGGLIWKLRQTISGKPPRNAEYFMSDLILHSLRAPFRPSAGPTPLPATTPLKEDRK